MPPVPDRQHHRPGTKPLALRSLENTHPSYKHFYFVSFSSEADFFFNLSLLFLFPRDCTKHLIQSRYECISVDPMTPESMLPSMTKYHNLGSLFLKRFFSFAVIDSESSQSRRKHVRCLMKAQCLVHIWVLVASTCGRRDRAALWGPVTQGPPS